MVVDFGRPQSWVTELSRFHLAFYCDFRRSRRCPVTEIESTSFECCDYSILIHVFCARARFVRSFRWWSKNLSLQNGQHSQKLFITNSPKALEETNNKGYIDSRLNVLCLAKITIYSSVFVQLLFTEFTRYVNPLVFFSIFSVPMSNFL